jgi:hypothetical protein
MLASERLLVRVFPERSGGLVFGSEATQRFILGGEAFNPDWPAPQNEADRQSAVVD